MSPRARRVVDGAATRYEWGGGGVSDSSGAPSVTHEEAAQHQAALAALEREAFATGYAQGERAGLEAGNTRAEAMLRRRAVTLDERTALRQTMIQQSVRQLV